MGWRSREFLVRHGPNGLLVASLAFVVALALEKLGRHVQRRADLAHRRRARAEFGLAKVGQLRRRLLDGHARGRDEQRVLRLDVAICGEGG